MPNVGLKLMLVLAAAADIALGLYLISKSELVKKHFVSAAALSLAALGFVTLFVKYDPLLIGSGVYRFGTIDTPADRKPLYHQDGKTATISVKAADTVHVIATNGKPDAGMETDLKKPMSSDEITMVMLGAMPLFAKPDAQLVANIGFGSGLTTHILLGSQEIKRVDSIEIEPAMVEGSKFFGKRVERAHTDPRSNVIFDDAKSYFAGKQVKYDVIVSEPSNPWVAGVSSLFSEEFYRFIPKFLNDDGVLIQWIQIYETDTNVIGSILKAMDKHFVDYQAYAASNTDMIIIASPKRKLPAMSDKIFSMPALQADLSRVGLRSLADIESRYVGGTRYLRSYSQASRMAANSDYFPTLAHVAPKLRFMNASAVSLSQLPTQPIPVVELIEGRPRTYWRNDGYEDDQQSRVGQEAYAYYAHKAFVQNTMDVPIDTHQIYLLKHLPCQSSAQKTEIHAVYYETVVVRLAALSATKASELLSSARKIACVESLDPDFHRFHDAIASRDAPLMLKQSLILEERYAAQKLPVKAERHLRLGAVASAIAMKENDIAKSLLDKPLNQAGMTDAYAMSMAVLANYNLNEQRAEARRGKQTP
jgi:spermidine synthase